VNHTAGFLTSDCSEPSRRFYMDG